jgi:hypothetical protein
MSSNLKNVISPKTLHKNSWIIGCIQSGLSVLGEAIIIPLLELSAQAPADPILFCIHSNEYPVSAASQASREVVAAAPVVTSEASPAQKTRSRLFILTLSDEASLEYFDYLLQVA